jgi:hypothetical protein
MHLWKVSILVAVLAAVIAGAFYYSRALKRNRLTEKDTIVLTDFANTTGDALFDDTSKQGLSVRLEQSPFLELISDRQVNDTLKLMGHAAGSRLTPEFAREVCVRTGSKAMLAATAKLGPRLHAGGRYDESSRRLPGVPHSVERCRY